MDVKGRTTSSLPLRVVALQLGSALVLAAALALVDPRQAGAALLAAAVSVVPGGSFAWRATKERSPGRLLGQGMMKFVLTVTLMALVFAVFKPPAAGFFSALVLMQLMYVVGPLVFGEARSQHRR